MAKALVDLAVCIPNLIIDLRYATTNNITGRILETDGRARLESTVAQKLIAAASDFTSLGYRVVIWDAYRTAAVQQALRMAGPQDDRYILPVEMSQHCLGRAVDLTLATMDGVHLTMGTDFDDFSDRAHVGSTDISIEAVGNRQLLSTTMAKYELQQWPHEWWHFDG